MTDSNIAYLPHEEIDKVKWDACIARSCNQLIYACSFYLDFMAEHWDALILNDYEAVMPLTWKKKYGIHYLYQPFCCAMLGIFSEDLNDEMVARFLHQIPPHFRYWDIYLNPGNKISGGNYVSTQRKNYTLSLSKSYDVLYSSYNDNLKRNIKKAVRQDCSVVKPSLADVLALVKNQMIKTAAIDAEDFLRFSKLYTYLNTTGSADTYGISDTTGNLIASCVFFTWQNRAYYIIAGNHAGSRAAGASHMLIDAFIKLHASTDTILDFEGSDIPGVALFYNSFGAKEENYPAVKNNRLPFLIKWLKN